MALPAFFREQISGCGIGHFTQQLIPSGSLVNAFAHKRGLEKRGIQKNHEPALFFAGEQEREPEGSPVIGFGSDSPSSGSPARAWENNTDATEIHESK